MHRILCPVCANRKNWLVMYLTLQEEEDSGLNEVGVRALSASPLRGTFLLRFPLAEQSESLVH